MKYACGTAAPAVRRCRFWLNAGMGLRLALAIAVLWTSLAIPGAALPPARKAVVVELFTSEGCSSCPPADALLGRLREEKLAQGLEVVPLGLHVDYWNFQGWIDRFSAPGFSSRQEKYAERFHIEGPYTPQMIVDGVWQFTGNDAVRARQAILQAAERPPQAQVALSRTGVDTLRVQVQGEPAGTREVMMALTEDNLVSKVHAGENDGRELHHAAVVRVLRSIGRLREGGFDAQVPLKLDKDWKRNDLRAVVFVQDPSTGRIDGSAAQPLSQDH